jgi:hypothetical protein
MKTFGFILANVTGLVLHFFYSLQQKKINDRREFSGGCVP